MEKVKFGRTLGYWGVGFGKVYPAKLHKLKPAAAGDIEFELSDGAIDDGYHFDTADPIWVCVDNGNCPHQRSTHPDITNIRPSNDRLTIHNGKVSGRVRLRYQLNVLNGENQPKPIDPIIEN
ncbi:MAG TPA: hypothetical protein VFO42_03520 [Sphingomicrobium sp.]|nr:hypothetical protein [Sphingomicrobium sp.]